LPTYQDKVFSDYETIKEIVNEIRKIGGIMGPDSDEYKMGVDVALTPILSTPPFANEKYPIKKPCSPKLPILTNLFSYDIQI